VLVYDPVNEQVHLLDPTTACVLEILESSESSRSGIVAEVARRLNVIPDESLLALAVEELRGAGLLDDTVEHAPPLMEVTRREMIRKLALTSAAAALVPAIATITATKGYAQGSITKLANGQSCPLGNNQCQSNLCCNGFCASTCNVVAGGQCPNGNSQCASGFCCSGTCGSVACGSLAACSTCQTSVDCAAGRNCNANNLCGTGNGAANGAPCNGGGNCCSGICPNKGVGAGFCQPA
jgi:hypothetical protein